MMTNADTFDMQCIEEGHASGCPCQAGGEPVYRCYACGRDTSDEDYVLVSLEWSGKEARVCSECFAKDEVSVPLDMTKDRWDA